MKESPRRMGKRLLSILLSISAAAGNLPAVVQQCAEPVLAANENSAEDLLDVLNLKNGTQQVSDDDTTTNPYGKKRNRLSGSDEVLIGQEDSGFLIGANSSVGQTYKITDPHNDNNEAKTRSFFSDHDGWFDENGVDLAGSNQRFICDLAVAEDYYQDKAKSYLRDAGYEVIDVDLNTGASSGITIYLGVKYTDNPADAITSVIVHSNGSDALTSDTVNKYGRNYTVANYRINGNADRFKDNRGDTNYRNSGDHCYICYSKDPDANGSIAQRNAITYITVDTNEADSCPGGSANDTSKSDRKRYVHAYAKQVIRVKAEGEKQQIPSELTSSSRLTISKTAAGYFDNKDGSELKTQYAMVKYDPVTNTLDLGVYDAVNPVTTDANGETISITTPMKLGWYDLVTLQENHVENEAFLEFLNSQYATAVLNVHTADFNNDGTDEIVVYNPRVETKNKDTGEIISVNGEVQVYMRTHNPGTSCYQFDTQSENASWKHIYSYSLPLGSVPSVNVGDTDNDGYDDLLISNNGETQISFGSATALGTSQELLIKSLYGLTIPDAKQEDQPKKELLVDTCAVAFNQTIPGEKKTDAPTAAPYVAVLGYRMGTDAEVNYRPDFGYYVMMIYRITTKNKTRSYEQVAEYTFNKKCCLSGLNDNRDQMRYQMTYEYPVFDEENHMQVKEGFINYPIDLHCMNGKMFSRWLYEICLVQNMDVQLNEGGKYEIEVTDCSYIDPDERLLTRGSSAGEWAYVRKNAYCYDFQTAVLNSKDSGGSGAGCETTFYQYAYTENHNYHKYGIGAYTAGNVEGDAPEMQPTAHFLFPDSTYCRGIYSGSDRPMMYAVVDTDNDSRSVTYTGKHWFQYSDPEILAVLSAPPYFKDLAAVDDSYADASTSFGSSKSTTQGTTESVSMSFGGYIKFNPKVKVMGIEIAGVESEIHTSTTFSQGFSVSQTTTFSIGYNTAGTDAVVFYSIPIECYEYEYTEIDENGNRRNATGTMFIPHEPCKNIKTLKEYRELCEYYPDMPKLADNVVEHTVGEPSTYPKTTKNYVKPIENLDLMNIDSNTEDGRQGFEGEISIDNEESYEYSCDMSLSWLTGVTSEVGGGGIEGEISAGAGYTRSDCDGMSFSCSLNKLPPEAANKGYSMNCKMFIHESSYVNQKGDVVTFPVVDYLVPSSSEPPHVPSNLKQDYEGSSVDSVALTWEYDAAAKDVSFFTVYRVNKTIGEAEADEVPIGTVYFHNSTKTADGKKYFCFVDNGTDLQNGSIDMVENTEYSYKVSASRSSSLLANNTSLLTPELVACTHSSAQHPTITLSGVYNNAITMYPDIDHNVKVIVGDTKGSLNYIWQKRNEKTGKWEDLSQFKSDTLPLRTLIENEEHPFDSVGEYRCKIKLTLPGSSSSVPVYSDSFFMNKKLRDAKVSSMTVSTKDNKLTANIAITPNDVDSASISKSLSTPGGSVSFKLYRGTELCLSRSVKLTASSSRTGIAVFEEDTSDINTYNGIYQLVVSYSGDKRFGAIDTEPVTVLFGDEKIYPITYCITTETDPETNEIVEHRQMTDTFSYMDTMLVEFHKLYNDENGVLVDTLVNDLPAIRKTISEVPKKEAYTSVERYFDQEIAYSYYVQPANVTVGINVPPQYLGENSEAPTIVKLAGRMLTDQNGNEDDLTKLVKVRYKNSAETFSELISIDTYTTALETNTDEPRSQYYNFTFNNVRFHVNPKRLDVTIQQPENGSIIVSMPEQFRISSDDTLTDNSRQMKAGSGTVAQMTAEPRVGYRLKKWTVDGAALTTNCTDTSNPISFTVSGRNVNVSAEFEEFNGTIEVDNSFVYSGKVICPEGFENNKPYGVGTELTFKMQGNDDYAPNLWILTCGNTDDPQRISGSEITVEVTGEPITLYPVFIGKPCTLTYPDGLIVNWLDEFLNPPVLSGKTVPKGSKICISNASENETLLLNGKEIEWTNGFYEFLIEGDTVIQRQSDLTATTEQTTTISTASESKTTASSASESKTTASSASESKTTVSSASESKTAVSSASESKTTVSSASESKTTASSASESETTVSSASESKTTVSSASESKTTASSASESETTASSASESKTTVSSASESKTTTTSSSVSTGTSSSVSATSPTVSTSGTTVSAETTTSAVRTETATSTESASSTTETTSAVPERIPGDVNGDGSVNLKDVTLIRRSIAGGWNITMDESAADVNGDHAVNLKDVTLIRRYIAGGWNVTLK